jgi:hypothetical protein
LGQLFFGIKLHLKGGDHLSFINKKRK